MGRLQIAIAGDLHDQWDHQDQDLIERLRPDALLLVGDFSEGHGRIASLLHRLSVPLACVLGNHDAGRDPSGSRLRRQLELLGELHCGWSRRDLVPPGLAVVGARPASAGGGYHLSRAARSAFGPVDLQESARRISVAALAAPTALPLILLAHCGPSGLGSEAADPCGRDWRPPACDWGDQDLRLAIEMIRQQRPVPMVLFGHMHHRLKRGQGERRSFLRDRAGTLYLNCACLPRHDHDQQGRAVRHLSWVTLEGGSPAALSHRWYSPTGQLLYEQSLWRRQAPAPCPLPLG
ncbi:MAG: TIGR04168 family protein [Synechococcaceae cyanobacterium]|nr:TIGR04168 family protein [Synechococcaceae cyanobacterium]